MESRAYKRVCVAGPFSGSGKTTVTLALISALVQQGVRVQPYKVGPDYVDTAYQSYAARRSAGNLDSFMMDPRALLTALVADAATSDIAVLEGCMGLFDGLGSSSVASTAEVAKLTKTSVILVIPAQGYAASAGALAQGYANFDPELLLVGFVVSKPSSKRHAALIAEAVTANTNLEYLGYLPKDPEFELPSRQLGLVPFNEIATIDAYLEKLAAQAAETLNLTRILELAAQAPALDVPAPADSEQEDAVRAQDAAFLSADARATDARDANAPTIAIAKDDAFSFYYRSSLQALTAAGAHLIEFSPLSNKSVPRKADALYLGGGYPEEFAKQLSRNVVFQDSLKRCIEAGMPVYAECGGYLYLMKALTTSDGQTYALCHIFEGHARMDAKKSPRFGYVYATAMQDTFLFKEGEQLKAHEFHHSKVEEEGKIFAIKKASSDKTWFTGDCYKQTVGTYAHIDFGSHPLAAKRFVAAAAEYKKRKEHGK